ncbi:MAG: hypothetical protein B7733_18015, partial [Myxococcales bacterium FL481]
MLARPFALVLAAVFACAGEPSHSPPPPAPASELSDSPSPPLPATERRSAPNATTSPPRHASEDPRPADSAQADAVAQVLAADPAQSTSLGSGVEGSLQGGLALPAHGPGFRHNPRKHPDRRYGTVELVQALVRAAAAVDRRSPGGEVTINDIAAAQGGDIPGHATHRSGRDVDVLFYLLDAEGHPRPGHAVPLEPDGTGVDYRDLATAEDDIPVRIDVARTWQFVEALLADTGAPIQRIYIVEHLRTMLLEHAQDHRAPAWIVSRFAEVTCQPRFPHDDHLHIRFFCSPQDITAGCLDDRPIYPWHRQALNKAGVRAQIAGPRTSPRPRL